MVDVMLAVTAKLPPTDAIAELQATQRWWFECKFDGIRALVTISADGSVSITNRRGRDVTFRYPEIVADWGRTGFVGTLDGEILCLNGEGLPDFSRIHRRDAQQSAAAANRLAASIPAVFMPFDVLNVAGEDTRALPYTRRHEILVGEIGAGQVSFASQDGDAMWKFVAARGMEGLMAKLGTASYKSGRQASWVKLRATKRGSVLVGGYSAGKGSRGAVGALDIFLWDPEAGKLASVGSVGSGMSENDTREVRRLLEAGSVVVVDVEYLEIAPSGKLRMPVFLQIRRDMDPADCLVGSLK